MGRVEHADDLAAIVRIGDQAHHLKRELQRRRERNVRGLVERADGEDSRERQLVFG